MRTMAEGLVCVVIAILLVWPFVAMGESPPPAGVSSAPSLELSLHVSKDTFQVGELVVLEVLMRNATKNPMVLQLPSTTEFGFLVGQLLQFTVRDATGKAVPMPGARIDTLGGSSRQQVLEPEGKVVLEYDLFALLGRAIAPGRYVVEARYEDKKAGIQTSSNALTLTVEEGTADDARALNLYRDVVRAGERPLAIELAQRLLKEYPRAPVADRAKEVLAENLFFVGRKSEAEALWRELLAARPTWRDQVRRHLAMYLHDQGKAEEAVQVLEPVKDGRAKISAPSPAEPPAATPGAPAGGGSQSGSTPEGTVGMRDDAKPDQSPDSKDGPVHGD